ncbi:hypothetical protein [Streptomyces sp. NPDC057557]|uniref:hypothetical protein n=1 Tax=Streptomyces sp. NPDC057557 TaxID=3346167 RepID=UPI0036C65913
MDPGLLPVQMPENPDQLRGMGGIHLGLQSLHLLQHGLPRPAAPLFGFREHGFGSGEVTDRLLDAVQNLGQALLCSCPRAEKLLRKGHAKRR